MDRVVNHLIQLQELILVRDQEAFMGGDRLRELDDSIARMSDELPPNVRTVFQKLRKKDSAIVTPISAGVCSTCGMKLPISLVQAVRALKAIHHCPNCSRILYYTDAPARTVARVQRRTEPQRVGIDRFSSPDIMIPRLAASERDGALMELATLMERAGYVEHADKLVEAALRREAIIPTTVTHGLAFPHVRGVEGGGLTLGLGISPKGIRFTPQEKNLTHIIFFILIPTAANAFYLKLLAGLAETFSDAEAREVLLAEEDPVKLWRALKKLTRRTVP